MLTLPPFSKAPSRVLMSMTAAVRSPNAAALGGILRNAGQLQHHLVDRGVLALRQLLDVILADRGLVGPDRCKDIAASIVERGDLRLDLSLRDGLLRLAGGLDRLRRRPALGLLLGR